MPLGGRISGWGGHVGRASTRLRLGQRMLEAHDQHRVVGEHGLILDVLAQFEHRADGEVDFVAARTMANPSRPVRAFRAAKLDAGILLGKASGRIRGSRYSVVDSPAAMSSRPVSMPPRRVLRKASCERIDGLDQGGRDFIERLAVGRESNTWLMPRGPRARSKSLVLNSPFQRFPAGSATEGHDSGLAAVLHPLGGCFSQGRRWPRGSPL